MLAQQQFQRAVAMFRRIYDRNPVLRGNRTDAELEAFIIAAARQWVQS